jgi:MFS family permease
MTATTISLDAPPRRSFREVWVISVGHALTHWYPATFYILLPFIASWFVFLVAVLGFFLFAVRAVLQAWLLDATPPGMGGSAIGVLFGMQALGMALGPLSAGIIADHYGIMAAFYFLAGTIVVANLLVFVTPAGLAPSDKNQEVHA